MYKLRYRSTLTDKTGGGETLYDKEKIDRIVANLNKEFPTITHWAQAETFDEWCNRNKIAGNWREALYHACMAEGAGNLEIHEELEALWMSEWNKILKDSLKKLS